MSEAGYVELPVIKWLSGYGASDPRDAGLGWTYRNAAAMAEALHKAIISLWDAEARLHPGNPYPLLQELDDVALNPDKALEIVARVKPMAKACKLTTMTASTR